MFILEYAQNLFSGNNLNYSIIDFLYSLPHRHLIGVA